MKIENLNQLNAMTDRRTRLPLIELLLELQNESPAGSFCLRPEHLSDDELLPDAQGLGDDVTHGVTQQVNVLPVTRAGGQRHSVKQDLRGRKYFEDSTCICM